MQLIPVNVDDAPVPLGLSDRERDLGSAAGDSGAALAAVSNGDDRDEDFDDAVAGGSDDDVCTSARAHAKPLTRR